MTALDKVLSTATPLERAALGLVGKYGMTIDEVAVAVNRTRFEVAYALAGMLIAVSQEIGKRK